MRHVHDRLTRTHTFTLSEDETEILSGWDGKEMVEPGMEIIKDYVQANIPLFTSRLMEARQQRARNYRRRFGREMLIPEFYVARCGALTEEERERLKGARPGDVIEVQDVHAISRFPIGPFR
ncbi:hypothetical protein UFOVP141_16 [uncultured Caudovirales phage]|uniref:Uncharacterized protein n=1 Tax=uncultured Caudovirales phage TaxID=2100421 RepID=A0A6J7VPN1_9CAUD|nr:hypothetical protein UFOVP141_16 [uncultured Caudovirales phage]